MNIKSKTLKNITLSFMAFSIFSAGLVSCGGKGNESALVFGKAKDAVKLDPADIADGESSAVTQNIFETLVKYKDESTEVEPALAESWKTSEDGLTWTFKLKKGIKFHDGTEFNAEAVKFNYDRQMDKKDPNRYNGKFEYWDLFFANVTKIEAKDNEVIFTLKDKDPTFLPNLALFTMGIASPKAIKEFGKDFFKNPVGTGPFKFSSWVQNEKIVLKVNEEYWGEKAKIKKLIFKPIPDNSVRLLELEKGSIQAMDGITPDDAAKIQENKDLTLLTQPGMNVAYMAMNTEKPPLDNPKVRMAINLAIDKNALVKAFFADGKVGMVATNPIPPTLWSYNDKIEPFKFDKEKAKALIKESGVNLDKTLDFWAMPIARPYMPNPSKIAESIQANLKDIGLKTKIVTYEWGTYLEKASKGEHDMCLLGWIGDNGDPDNFMYALLSSNNTKKGSASNYAFYKSPEMDKYLNDAKKELDHQKRIDDYMKAQEVFHKDVPWVPLFHSTQIVAFRKEYKGYKLHPTGAKLFKGVFIDKN
ncbi:MAG: ABC transporter substrate-binding protein [Candidatus Sericytochromatia bacterium]